MVMYVETTREGKQGDATTLEEAAEELLNGLLCHYEPPDSRTIKKMKEQAAAAAGLTGGGASNTRRPGQRGILRASKLLRSRRSKRGRQSKSVRWKDEQNKGKTPAMYDIGQGCKEALTECGNNTEADFLQEETERLAEWTAKRAPKPISKRIRSPAGDPYGDDDDNDDDDEDDIRVSVNNIYPHTTKPIHKKDPTDPITSYRDAMSPSTDTSTPNDGGDRVLFDDQGNLVARNMQEPPPSMLISKYGPPPSPATTPQHQQQQQAPPPLKRNPTPYKQQRPTMDGSEPTLCGIMCDPQYLNCEVIDGDFPGDRYGDYPPRRPPPPPPPAPARADQYFYEDTDNSSASGSEGGTADEDEDEIVETPRKRGLRERFRRKSKKSSGSSSSQDDDPKSPGRGRSKSPKRRGRSPSRSKSPSKSTLKPNKKYPMSPMSFITGNRSFSRSPHSKEARENSEANYSVQSSGSSSKRRSKSPLRRMWFGSRDDKSAHDVPLNEMPSLMPSNSDWSYSHYSQGGGPYNGYQDPQQWEARGRSMERQDHLSSSRSGSYERLDHIDRSRLSDFDCQDQGLRPSRSRSLDRQDERGRSRLNSYERAESHIGQSRISFDDDDMLRPSRSRSLDRQDQQQLHPTRQDLQQIHPTRSRSLDRLDQRSQMSADDRRAGFEYGHDDRPGGPDRSRSMESDPYMDPRRSASYPGMQPQQHTAGDMYDNRRGMGPAPQQPPYWPPPAADETRQEYLDRQYHSFMAQRTSSYPPRTMPEPFSYPDSRRRSFDYAPEPSSPSRNRIQQWWENRRSQSMEQRKPAAEPPAAVYSHEPPRQETRPKHLNSIYSHDPQVAPTPPVIGRDMPPTPMHREMQPQYAAQAHYSDVTPSQRNATYENDGRGGFDEFIQQQRHSQSRRDPTPRNRHVDIVQPPSQTQEPFRSPSPSFSRSSRPSFNVAEEIHRVSWGEPPRRETETEDTYRPAQDQISQMVGSREEHSSFNGPGNEEKLPRIPPTLPGKDKSRAAMPPLTPPPPPPHPQQQRPQLPPHLPQQQRPPKPPQNRQSDGTSGIQIISEKEEITSGPVDLSGPTRFEDLVDENKPLPPKEPRKEAKGRSKLLGIFGLKKGKGRRSSTGSRYTRGEGRDAEVDDSIFSDAIHSDAILRDRHERFVTKL